MDSSNSEDATNSKLKAELNAVKKEISEDNVVFTLEQEGMEKDQQSVPDAQNAGSLESSPMPTRTSRRIQTRAKAKTDSNKNSKETVKNNSNNTIKSSSQGRQKKTNDDEEGNTGKNSRGRQRKAADEKKISVKIVSADESPRSKRSRKQSQPKRASTKDEDKVGDDEEWVPIRPLTKMRTRSGNKRKLNKSAAAKNGGPSFPCSKCAMVLSSATKLKMHDKMRHMSYKCKYCNTQYRNQMWLTRHEQRHISGSSRLKPVERQFKCKHCDLTWVVEAYHKRHEAICEGPHTCEKCGNVFSNLRKMKGHKRYGCIESENMKRKTVCTYCGQLVYKDRMTDHMINHTGQSPHVCEICKKVFRSKRNLARHENLHKITGKVDITDLYHCKYCNQTCKSQLYLDFHEKRHQGHSPYQCTECQESFFSVNKFYEHQRGHQGSVSLVCPTCKKTYRNKRCLDRHMRTHTKEDSVQCPTCFKVFSTSGNLKVHMRIHTKEVQFQCEHCGKVFAQKSALQYHEQSHKVRIMYDCPSCDNKYTTSYYRDLHLRMKHTKKDLPTCPHCAMVFPTDSTLKRHIYKVCAPDTFEENVFCRHCNIALKNSYLLEQHYNKIHKERDYSCKVCEFVSTKASGLRTHMRVHTGERPYICEHCGKGFKQRTTLKNHEKLHTGEKPYQCHICAKSFIQKYNLTCHIRIHTGDRPWVCKHCDKGFTQQTGLKVHEDKCGKGLIKPVPVKKPARRPSLPMNITDDNPKRVNSEDPEALPKNLIKIHEDQDQQIVTIIVHEGVGSASEDGKGAERQTALEVDPNLPHEAAGETAVVFKLDDSQDGAQENAVEVDPNIPHKHEQEVDPNIPHGSAQVTTQVADPNTQHEHAQEIAMEVDPNTLHEPAQVTAQVTDREIDPNTPHERAQATAPDVDPNTLHERAQATAPEVDPNTLHEPAQVSSLPVNLTSEQEAAVAVLTANLNTLHAAAQGTVLLEAKEETAVEVIPPNPQEVREVHVQSQDEQQVIVTATDVLTAILNHHF